MARGAIAITPHCTVQGEEVRREVDGSVTAVNDSGHRIKVWPIIENEGCLKIISYELNRAAQAA